MRAVNGCIGTDAHGHVVTLLLCLISVIVSCCISEYSGSSGAPFKHKMQY